MNIKYSIKGIMFIALLIFLSFPVSYSASNEVYSVTPVLTELQDEAIENYVHIKTDKKISREFEYKITNRSSSNLTLKVTALNALTSPNGVIQYIEGTEEDNSILTNEEYSFSKYVEKLDDIIIPKQETKIIKVKIDIPLLKGQILGGIGFSSVTDGDTVVEGNNQFKINNEVKTVVAFLSEFSKIEKADIEFGEPFINPMPSYYAIRLPLELKSPTILESPVIKYLVTDKDGKEVFKSVEDKPLNFSPMSKINYVIPWDNTKITKDEKYTIKGSISYILNDSRQVDEFKKTFTLTGEESVYGESLVEEIVVEDNSIFSDKVIYALLSLVVILIVVAITMFLKFKDKNVKSDYVEEYVLFSTSVKGKEIITKDDYYFYEKLIPVSEADNENELPYALIYTKEYDEDFTEEVYKFKEYLYLTN